MSATSKTYYKSPSGSIAVDALTKQVLTVANQLLALPQFGAEKEPMTGLQGSYRPYTSYSGSTHTGCAAVDLTAYNWRNRLIVLDLLGIIYCHRLESEGDWPEHGHTMTNGLGCASAALKGQIEELEAGGDGLSGSRPDRDRYLRSLLWPLAVYNGRTGKLKATTKTNLRTGPSYERDVIRPAPVDTVVNAIMEVNVGGKRWFVTDKGEWGYSGKWTKISWYQSTPPQVPAQRLNLTNWKLTMPIGSSGNPLEVKQPELATYSHPKWFTTVGSTSGVVFRTPVTGTTTENSSYPRTELREMKNGGKDKANWGNRSGIHTLAETLAVTKFPPKKPKIVVGQIHDAVDDVVMIRTTKITSSTMRVEAMWSKGPGQGSVDVVLDAAAPIGKKFSYRIIATKSGVVVNYLKYGTSVWKQSKNPKAILRTGGMYFKAGTYLQTNEDIEADDKVGTVIIYSLKATHAAD